MTKFDIARKMALAGMSATLHQACDHATAGTYGPLYGEFLECYTQAWNDDPLRGHLRNATFAKEHHHATS